jgi:hypothetical protein
VPRLLIAFGIGGALVTVGMLGAWSFNPDDGALVRSEPLWRVFGIGVYLGAALTWLSLFAALIAAVVRGIAAAVRCRRLN